MFFFQNIIRKDDLGISKVMKISLPNFNDTDFGSKKSTEKSLVGVALVLNLMNLAIFCHISQYIAKG